MSEFNQNNFRSSSYISIPEPQDFNLKNWKSKMPKPNSARQLQYSKDYATQKSHNKEVWVIILSVSVFPILALILLLYSSQLGGKDIYGTYYNDPLEAEWKRDKNNHPCIVLQLNRDGSFEQTAYYFERKVLTLKGNYKNTENGLNFPDFIFYYPEVDSENQKATSKRFMHRQGYFLTDSQHWYNSYSIPSGNGEDNYYVKPRNGRCKSLP